MTAKKLNHLVAITTLAIVAFYLTYRALYTFPDHGMWFAVLFYAAECHGALVLALFIFETWDPLHPEPKPAPPGLNVDIFICTYDESPQLLRKTILGAEAIAYPHRTYVCDDGHRESVRQLAEELGVNYITRPDNAHAKAGNINHALQHTDGDFIAILDADHVPLTDFLDRMLGYFDDPKVAFVQSPQAFYNLDAFEERVDYDKGKHWEEASIFFHLILPGKNRWNSVYFCGTGGIIRREALEQIGGFATDTITEDIHTALKIHARGWKSVYIAEHLASGQAAQDLRAYHIQRTRWALGNLRVMFCSNPLFIPGLTIAQRLSYFSSMFHWTIGLRKSVMYAAPILMLLAGIYPITAFTGFLIGLYVTQLAVQFAAFKFITRGRGRIMADEIFGMINFWVFTCSFIRACLKLGAQKFEVTEKSGKSVFAMTSVRPHLCLLGISFVALMWGVLRLIYRVDVQPVGIAVGSFWCCYNAALAWWVVHMATRADQEKPEASFVDHIPVLIRLPEVSDHPERLAITTQYGESGMTVITYEPLQLDQQLDATLVLRFFRLSVRVRVASNCCLHRRHKKRDTYAYYLQFIDLDDVSRDLLNTHTMLYTTPRLLNHLGERSRQVLHDNSLGWLKRHKYPRRRIDFPINLDPDHNAWVHSRVERIDTQNATLLTEASIESGRSYPFLMVTPLGPASGMLLVLSGTERLFHGSPVWNFRVRFDLLDHNSAKLIKELAVA